MNISDAFEEFVKPSPLKFDNLENAKTEMEQTNPKVRWKTRFCENGECCKSFQNLLLKLISAFTPATDFWLTTYNKCNEKGDDCIFTIKR